MKDFNIGIVGCGLIGKKRANIIKKIKNCKIKYCSDNNLNKLKYFNQHYNCKTFLKWQDLLKNKDIDILFISTTHNLLSKITELALKKNIHVFCEKPGAASFVEISKIKKLYRHKKNLSLYYGFNHLLHPAFIKLKELIAKNKNKIGPLMYVKASYGHGGRINYDKEWRFKKKISGGGELIDKGSHLINLGLYFMGELKLLKSYLKKFYWKINSDDNAFLFLENKNKNIFFLHASCTEWKNKFIFEIVFKNAKFIVDGLGSSYGIEKLIYYQMKKEMGKPLTKVWTFPEKDNSWEKEINSFLRSIKDKKYRSNIDITINTLKIISNAYSN